MVRQDPSVSAKRFSGANRSITKWWRTESAELLLETGFEDQKDGVANSSASNRRRRRGRRGKIRS